MKLRIITLYSFSRVLTVASLPGDRHALRHNAVENANLITKTVFPSEILPVSIFLSSLLSHLLALILALPRSCTGLARSARWRCCCPCICSAGPVCRRHRLDLLSLQVYLRDTAQVLKVVMTLWFWITPIFISEQLIPERLRILVRLNPLALVVKAYRERLLSYRFPDVAEFALLTAYAAGLFSSVGSFSDI